MTSRFLVGVAIFLGTVDAGNAAMIAHWSFDEQGGSIAHDSSGVSNVNGTLVGGATFTGSGGVLGGALSITEGYVDMGNHFPPSSRFSIQAWVRLESGDETGYMPVSKHNAYEPAGYILSINDIGDGSTRVGTAGFFSADGVSVYDTANGGPPVNDGSWHQLVGVYNQGVTSIYIDGVLSDTGSAGFSDNTASFLLGALFVNGTPARAYYGLIDEVALFNTALTATEVKSLYNAVLSAAQAKPQISIDGGFIRLDTTNGVVPSRNDCVLEQHYGRQLYDEVNDILYMCSRSGWLEH